MKRLFYLLSVLLAVSAFVACSGKGGKDNKDTLLVQQDSADAHGTKRMQVSKSETDIQFKGKDYHISLSRTPSDSLPHVNTEMGDEYLDNQIVLRITRGNERVFSKTFTKRSFASLLDEEFMSKSILEGMVFDKSTPQGMVFAASISYPQTDLYVPVSITITADGGMSLKKEELMEDVYSEDSI
ncbi:DUF4738 domain-containing protein [Bacteroides graminisolvens]|uniref:DUF4738 domain-containing protein n=1 Tax=Bacteroides graminisolvens TaxID=477666 RepID=UPI0023F0CC0F|nr:DUF4738 domain-containing protein [Bacteroides graminisolvens]